MTDVQVDMSAREATIEAVVVRCGCKSDWRQIHERYEDGSYGPCPTPKRVQDLGVISYWHRNPLRRLFWRLKHLRG